MQVEWTELPATLRLPDGAEEIVVLPDGGCELSARLAEALEKTGLGTLLLNLLTEEEFAVRRLALDLHFLARRLCQVARWLRERPGTRGCKIGLCATGTSAAAALIAAANEPRNLSAIVSVNGRPDLALYSISRVEAPTLFIVGSPDTLVAERNQRVYQRLLCAKEMQVLPAAIDARDPRVVGVIATAAADWFKGHLRGPGQAHRSGSRERAPVARGPADSSRHNSSFGRI